MKRIGDLLRSLGVVLAVVAVVLVLTPRPNQVVRPVDWAGTQRQAAASAAYEVWGVRSLPAGWRPTSARVGAVPDGSVAWTMTMVSPAGDYGAVAQSDGDVEVFLADLTKDGVAEGTVDVAGRTWERRYRRLGEEPRRSLVREQDGAALVVTGTASWAELGQLAALLRPLPAGR